jgi:hypothetical protein
MARMSAASSVYRFGPYPPAFDGSQAFYMFGLFGLMWVSLLALEWTWRVIWSFVERPLPLRHPVTAARCVILLMLATSLMRGGPDTILYMRWPEMSPGARAAWAQINVAFDGWAFVPFTMAWLLDRLAIAVIIFQLKREPLPTDLWPTWSTLRQPAKIGFGVFVLAFAITYLQ